jgi:hypothetical protein
MGDFTAAHQLTLLGQNLNYLLIYLIDMLAGK